MNEKLRDVAYLFFGITVLLGISLWYTPENYAWFWGLGSVVLLIIDYLIVSYGLVGVLSKTFNSNLVVLMLAITILNMSVFDVMNRYLIFMNGVVGLMVLSITIITIREPEIDSEVSVTRFDYDKEYKLDFGYFKVGNLLMRVDHSNIYLIHNSEECNDIFSNGDDSAFVLLALLNTDMVLDADVDDIKYIDSVIRVYSMM